MPYRHPPPPPEPEPRRPWLCRVGLHLWSATFEPEIPMHGAWILYCTRCPRHVFVNE